MAIMGLSACSSDTLPKHAAAYDIIPAAATGEVLRDYRLGPLDTVSVTVFDEPELSVKEVQINAAGVVGFPLIGEVAAAGRTSGELAREIADRLNTRYLKNPQVSVAVVSSVSQKVTVEGNVEQPGVYAVEGEMTLLKALALAHSPTRVASVDEIVVFRTINGKRTGAIFNVNDIRRGKSPDPQIYGNDTVVVGFSAVKGAFRDFLTIAPAAIATFVRY